ncbi:MULTISPECIES: 4Fe-4S cluster-binding domain-containing protein [Pseudomonas]|uniref:Radical SAM protein n=1 Tax=Pseudomonas putida TaxID=303 RepID=A0AAW5HF39_PSEPU|nr:MULTISPECIES: 4Fe-4S cluster-binding domain-containing protein [Pseudomonas]WHH53107.1 4Fe-4S cluster-binding domain-containing protein [Pseudomonas sp. Ap32]MBP2271827.1 anaerobic ribonucleoside-triphosphate reductase activating protein [Pseudomonas sp. BP6]MCO1619173.1 radical SAM protein [Pseudomonas putida]HDS1695187.1 4Fe-4S cluster-binding domain-containing protein [Pseudomonas putida]HDS1700357.1 4Fe-4S cluster-binding domain-containing protein [Pseudomonas putida]
MELSLSRVHFPVTTLGPGRRLGIWFQGCSIRCAGCISVDTWGPGKRRVGIAQLLKQLMPWLAEAEGITVSGGEPFDQFPALLAMLQGLRQSSPLDILVYSGYSLEQLQPQLQQAEGLIDALISDPFDKRSEQSLALRGSDNQRLNLLTPLGHERLASYQRPLQPADQALDLMFDENGSVWMAGIPRRDDVLRLRDLLNAQGHQVSTSVHRH